MGVDDETVEPEQSETKLSRRGALGAVAGVIVGAAAMSATPAGATGPSGLPLILETENVALDLTVLNRRPSLNTGDGALQILNSIDLAGTIGSSATLANSFAGLVGAIDSASVTVTATALLLSAGVVGLSDSLAGVVGSTGGPTIGHTVSALDMRSGVVGLSNDTPGLLGIVGSVDNAFGSVTFTSPDMRAGVVGLSPNSPGLMGIVGSAATAINSITATAGDLRAGVVGLSPDSPGILGVVVGGPRRGLPPTGSGTQTARSFPRAGVVGLSPDSPGVFGMVGATSLAQTITLTAFFNLRAGVVGLSPDSPGVMGVAGSAAMAATVTSTAAWIGVRGVALDALGVGIEAVGASQGLALNVVGSVAFSTSGKGAIPINKLDFAVVDKNIKSTSSVYVSLLSNPGTSSVKWVEIKPGAGFTIHLTKAPTSKLTFSYFRIG